MLTKFLIAAAALVLAVGAFFLLTPQYVVEVAAPSVTSLTDTAAGNTDFSQPPLEAVAEAVALSRENKSSKSETAFPDIEPQPQLSNPPEIVKAIYLTSWSAGSAAKVRALTALAKKEEWNGVVIDLKDYSGYLAYRTSVPELQKSGAQGDIRIARPNALIKELHDQGIYVIGRVSVFQDPILAKAHPEWALQKADGKTWTDRRGLAWLDPAAKPAWDYAVIIAQDAASRGFDEINFDYIRFPSDGDLSTIRYPFWSGKEPRQAVLRKFFAYLREHLPNVRISADLFGLTTVATDDLGIGQIIEDAYANFDYVSPMVYPSHYAPGFLGYQNPAKHPYEVVKDSMAGALRKLTTYNQKLTTSTATDAVTSSLESTQTSSSVLSVVSYKSKVKLRPWLQVFDLGAIYDLNMVESQMTAVSEVLNTTSSREQFAGWLLWDPANNYRPYQ